jgi:CRISPR-associated protein Csm4
VVEKFRVRLKINTPLATPFQSDTLFGEFCWHFGFLYGFDRLEKLLKQEVFVAFSDVFPEGWLPMPKFPLKGGFDSVESYKRFKELKKKKFIKVEVFTRAIEESNDFKGFGEKLYELAAEEEERKPLKQSLRVRVAINRLTGTAYEGKLFQEEESFPKEEFFNLYGLFEPALISRSEVKAALEFLGLSGFGAKKSSGKGKFEIVEFTEGWNLPERGDSWFISLSTGLPEKEEIEDFYADFFTKFPKHGREVARPEVFKEPLILSRPGSIFRAREKKEVYGSLVGISAPALKSYKHSRVVVPLFVG